MQNFFHQPNGNVVARYSSAVHSLETQHYQRSTFSRNSGLVIACVALFLIVSGSVFALFQGMQASKHPGAAIQSPALKTSSTTTYSSNSGIYVAMQSYLYKLDKSGKTKLWEHEIKGLGSSIAITDGIVYAYSTSNELSHLSYVYAFRATDGHTLWKVLMTPNQVHNFGNLVADNQNVYVSSIDGIHALKAANGKQNWVYHINNVYFDVPVRMNIANDVLYIGASYRFYAIHTANGHLSWMKSDTINNGMFSEPRVAHGIVYATLSKRMVPRESPSVSTIYAWTTRGDLLWHSQQINAFIPDAPAIGDNQLYVVGENRVYALNSANGKISWQQFVGTTNLSRALFDHDTLYLSLEGPYQWTPAPGPNNTFITNAIALNAHNGSLIWQKSYPWSGPFIHTIIHGVLYMELQDYKGHGYVYAISIANHATLWSYNHPIANPGQAQGEGNSLIVIP